MDLGLKDKVALVTGGSSGIGRATALAFAGEGAKVAVVGRDAERLQQVVAALQAVGSEGFAIRADLVEELSLLRKRTLLSAYNLKENH